MPRRDGIVMRRALRAAGTAGAAALLLVPAGTAEAAARASASAGSTAPAEWKVTQTTGLPGDDLIRDVSIAPTGSGWAVGEQFYKSKTRPIVQRLSGSTWKPVTMPAKWSMELDVVDASSATNVWAFANSGQVVRWNGRAWSLVKKPGGTATRDAEALSATNVWTVNGTATARRWNGKKWLSVKLPAMAVALHAVSAKNIWAGGTVGGKAALIHWNGSVWKVVKKIDLPKPEPDAEAGFRSVTVSGNSVWAVGGQEWACGVDGDDTCAKPLALRLTGSKSALSVGAQSYTGHSAVAPDGSGGVWVLHGSWDPKLLHFGAGGALTETVTAPRPAGHDIGLMALVNRPGTKTLWSAGGSFPEGDPDDPTGDGLYLRIG